MNFLMNYKDVLALFIQSLGVLATFILLSAFHCILPGNRQNLY